MISNQIAKSDQVVSFNYLFVYLFLYIVRLASQTIIAVISVFIRVANINFSWSNKGSQHITYYRGQNSIIFEADFCCIHMSWRDKLIGDCSMLYISIMILNKCWNFKYYIAFIVSPHLSAKACAAWLSSVAPWDDLVIKSKIKAAASISDQYRPGSSKMIFKWLK